MLGSFLIIKNIIREEIFSFIKNSLLKYLRKEHGYNADICVIDIKDGLAYYKMSTTSGVVPGSLDAIDHIRLLCGQHILVRFGIPTENKPPFVLKLLITPDFIKRFGIRSSISFCKNWIGDSKVGDVVVVKYL